MLTYPRFSSLNYDQIGYPLVEGEVWDSEDV